MLAPTWCPNCNQSVEPTRGGFLPAYIAALVFTTVALASTGGPPTLAYAVALSVVVDVLIFVGAHHFYPEDACPVCKSRSLAERAPAH